MPAAALFAVASRGRMASPDISVLRRVCSCLRRLGYRSVRTADSRPAGARGGRGSSTCGREPVILPATLAPRSTRICSIDQKRLQAAVEFGGDDGGSRGCCLCLCRVGAVRGGARPGSSQLLPVLPMKTSGPSHGAFMVKVTRLAPGRIIWTCSLTRHLHSLLPPLSPQRQRGSVCVPMARTLYVFIKPLSNSKKNRLAFRKVGNIAFPF